MTRFHKKLWLGIAVMAALTPLGILLPRMFGSGGAWGEWGAAELERLLGFVPEGIRKLGELWKAPVNGYGAGAGASTGTQSVLYIASALLGIVLAGLLVYLISRALIKKDGK
jgi:hypothetical protein